MDGRVLDRETGTQFDDGVLVCVFCHRIKI